jgi:hypothetical protein
MNRLFLALANPPSPSWAGWSFATQAGKEEIRNRRIGRNELAVIEVLRAYVDAQREYYLRNPTLSALLH